MQKQQPTKIKWVNPLKDRTRVIPFVVPTQQERLHALGSLVGEKWRLRKTFQAIYHFFQPIRKPQPGDNLYQFQQDGQDFNLFSSMYRNHIDKDQQIIYIATFFSKISQNTIKQLKLKVKAFFHGIKIKLHQFHFKKQDLKQFGQKISENGESYYDGARINTYFTKHLPKKTYSIAIITNLLIYNGNNPKEELAEQWVFGLGSIKDRTSIISFEQIVKKGYGQKKDEKQQDQNEVNVQFLSKVIHHQLCHTFGMKHCIFNKCLMNGSNHYEQALRKDEHLCVICLRKLQYAIGFDVVERYQKLGDDRSVQYAKTIRNVIG